jgi:hypothetical protein
MSRCWLGFFAFITGFSSLFVPAEKGSVLLICTVILVTGNAICCEISRKGGAQ